MPNKATVYEKKNKKKRSKRLATPGSCDLLAVVHAVLSNALSTNILFQSAYGCETRVS